MKIGDYLEKRQAKWDELEALHAKFSTSKGRRKATGEQATAFANAYRSACSDLAMANENRLPTSTVRYLHNLVGRCHNQIYRSGGLATKGLFYNVFTFAPQKIMNDVCVQIASLLFFGLFTLSALFASMAHTFPKFAESVLGQEQIDQLEESFVDPLDSTDEQDRYVIMSAFYIQHNTSIGLRCFGEGILIIPCLIDLSYNAIVLGASFGYMAREDSVGGENFLEFTTAHGPFELTAIVLSAAAGLRLGIGFFVTNGLKRFDSIRNAAQEAVPIILCAVTLFTLAAFTEGCISPTALPYPFKALWAIISSALMMFYFVVLGSLEEGEHAA